VSVAAELIASSSSTIASQRPPPAAPHPATSNRQSELTILISKTNRNLAMPTDSCIKRLCCASSGRSRSCLVPTPLFSWYFSLALVLCTCISGTMAIEGQKPNHICVVTNTSGLKCWGSYTNSDHCCLFGQLGLGSTYSATNPTDVPGLESGVMTVALGSLSTCALVTPGIVKCWGYNGYGQLGIGTTTDKNTPTDVTALGSNVVFVAAGGVHACAIVVPSFLKCWGRNRRGQLGIGSTTDRSTPADVGNGFVFVALGNAHTCAITSNGTIQCWGANDDGQLGIGSTTQQSAPVSVTGISDTAALHISCSFYTCAVFVGGGLKCWGGNHLGYLGTGNVIASHTPAGVIGLSRGVIRVSTGWFFTCAIVSGNALMCWGHDGYTWQNRGLLGMATQAGKCSGYNDHYCESTPQNVSGLSSGVISVASGQMHSCAASNDNIIKCWGSNQIPTAQFRTPTNVQGLFVKSLWSDSPFITGKCPAGSYSKDGAVSCLLCEQGSFQKQEGMGMCQQCPAGTHCNASGLRSPSGNCSAGSFSAVGASACTPCAAGSYQPLEGMGMCQECPAGTHCNASGLSAPSGLCSAGSFAAGGMSSSNCTPCLVGHHCNSSGLTGPSGRCGEGYFAASGEAACTQCPSGSFCNSSGLRSPSGNCSAGSFSAVGASACTPCAAGSYQPLEGMGMCQECPAGTHCNASGLSAPSGLCSAGSFAAGGMSSSNCTPCLVGHHCNSSGLTGPSGRCGEGYFAASGEAACTQCPSGSFCNSSGLRSPSGNCSAGSFSAVGASACTPCAAGSYQPQEGMGMCQECPSGRFCSSVALAHPTGICPAGFFSLSNSLVCSACPIGKFSALNGSSECSACNSGYISVAGSSSCQQIMHPAIIFKLHGSVDSFTETSDRRIKFIAILVEKVSLSPFFEPIIVAVTPGSVIVDLVFFHHSGSVLLVDDVIMRLRASFRSGDFEAIGAVGLTIGGEAISEPESGIFVLAIITISATGFLTICMFGMFALKKRLDANKIHPFVSDQGSLSDPSDLNTPAASQVTTVSTVVPSNLPIDCALARASPQDQSADAIFRRVLPGYDAAPSIVQFKSAKSSSGASVPSFADNSCDVPNIFPAKSRQ
jgi:alpha-tubulin suppressor-like RCC1 family protein